MAGIQSRMLGLEKIIFISKFFVRICSDIRSFRTREIILFISLIKIFFFIALDNTCDTYNNERRVSERQRTTKDNEEKRMAGKENTGKSSHSSKNGQTEVIPVHGKEIPTGLLNAILKRTGLK